MEKMKRGGEGRGWESDRVGVGVNLFFSLFFFFFSPSLKNFFYSFQTRIKFLNQQKLWNYNIMPQGSKLTVVQLSRTTKMLGNQNSVQWWSLGQPMTLTKNSMRPSVHMIMVLCNTMWGTKRLDVPTKTWLLVVVPETIEHKI